MNRSAGAGVRSVAFKNESVGRGNFQIPGTVNTKDAAVITGVFESCKGDVVGFNIQRASRRGVHIQTDCVADGIWIALKIQVLQGDVVRFIAIVEVVQSGVARVNRLLCAGRCRLNRKLGNRIAVTCSLGCRTGNLNNVACDRSAVIGRFLNSPDVGSRRSQISCGVVTFDNLCRHG